ncbi:DUF2066 domain-containing protein [Galenea microaerophila]
MVFKLKGLLFWGVMLLIAWQVQAAPDSPIEQIDLYQIVLPQAQSEEAPPSLDDRLKEGMAKLLVRLSGNRQVLQNPAYHPFLQAPRHWLKKYYFRPRIEDGVQVGQDLVLNFDRERILKAFQQKGLMIWPYDLRPKLLVVGEFEVAGIKVTLDQQGLQQHLNLDFRPAASGLGLPIRLLNPSTAHPAPLSTLMWQTPQVFEQVLPKLKPLLAQNGVDGIVLLRLKRIQMPEGDGYQLTYELYDQKFEVLPKHTLNEIVLPKTLTDSDLKKLYETLFSEVAEYFSAPYRAQASILGEVQLTVTPASLQHLQAKHAFTPEQVFEIEHVLQRLKPTLHEAKLTQLSAQKLQFDLTYQGQFERLVKVLKQTFPLYWVSADALHGEVKMQAVHPNVASQPESVPAVPQQSLQKNIEQSLQNEFNQALEREAAPTEEMY